MLLSSSLKLLDKGVWWVWLNWGIMVLAGYCAHGYSPPNAVLRGSGWSHMWHRAVGKRRGWGGRKNRLRSAYGDLFRDA